MARASRRRAAPKSRMPIAPRLKIVPLLRAEDFLAALEKARIHVEPDHRQLRETQTHHQVLDHSG